MNEYSTLPKLREYLSLASQQTDDDELLKNFLHLSSRSIDEATKRWFYPERKTRRFNLPEDSQLLKVDDDLIEVFGLSSHNGSSEIDSEAYWPRQGSDWNETPYDRIEININTGSLFNFTGTPQRAVELDAVWGYRTNYDETNEGWQDTGTSLASTIENNATSIVLSGASTDGDIFGSPSRIQDQHTLKIGDEYIYVNFGLDDDSLSVRRGVNGTSAITHTSGASIARWVPEPDIEFATRELAAYEYMRSTTPLTARITTFGGGGVSVEQPFSDGLPPSVRRRLSRFIKRRIYNL